MSTFIVIDGLDASGKSTQAELLKSYIKKHGKTYILRSHPSEDNFFGMKGRKYLTYNGRNAHIAASLFYLFDVLRSITLYVWRRVDYIIFVRYLIGSAYLPTPIHKFTYLFFSKTFPTKGHLIFLKISPTEAFHRIINNRIITERFETIEELRKTAKKTLDLLSDGKWTIIDGDMSIKKIHENILREVGFK